MTCERVSAQQGAVQRGRGDSPPPSFRGRRPWNPPRRGNSPTVDAEGSPSPPSSSQSGDPPRRGRAVRCRYPGATNGGIPARSARMTAEFEKARRYPGATNQGILRSLALPLNDRKILQSLPLNDEQEGKRAAGCIPSRKCLHFSETVISGSVYKRKSMRFFFIVQVFGRVCLLFAVCCCIISRFKNSELIVRG